MSKPRYFISDFVEIQRKSFFELLQKGIIEEFSKRNPITSLKKDIELFFYPEYFKLTVPEYSPRQAIIKSKSYTSKLYLPVQLTYKKSNIIRLKWAYIGNLPLMTKRGHFILNGAPRVIVNQIIRSPGIYYQEKLYETFSQKWSQKPEVIYKRFYADLICLRGTWLRLEIDKDKNIWAQTKKGPKIPVFWFLIAMGLSERIIFNSVLEPNRLIQNLEIFSPVEIFSLEVPSDISRNCAVQKIGHIPMPNSLHAVSPRGGNIPRLLHSEHSTQLKPNSKSGPVRSGPVGTGCYSSEVTLPRPSLSLISPGKRYPAGCDTKKRAYTYAHFFARPGMFPPLGETAVAKLKNKKKGIGICPFFPLADVCLEHGKKLERRGPFFLTSFWVAPGSYRAGLSRIDLSQSDSVLRMFHLFRFAKNSKNKPGRRCRKGSPLSSLDSFASVAKLKSNKSKKIERKGSLPPVYRKRVKGGQTEKTSTYCRSFSSSILGGSACTPSDFDLLNSYLSSRKKAISNKHVPYQENTDEQVSLNSVGKVLLAQTRRAPLLSNFVRGERRKSDCSRSRVKRYYRYVKNPPSAWKEIFTLFENKNYDEISDLSSSIARPISSLSFVGQRPTKRSGCDSSGAIAPGRDENPPKSSCVEPCECSFFSGVPCEAENKKMGIGICPSFCPKEHSQAAQLPRTPKKENREQNTSVLDFPEFRKNLRKKKTSDFSYSEPSSQPSILILSKGLSKEKDRKKISAAAPKIRCTGEILVTNKSKTGPEGCTTKKKKRNSTRYRPPSIKLRFMFFPASLHNFNLFGGAARTKGVKSEAKKIKRNDKGEPKINKTYTIISKKAHPYSELGRKWLFNKFMNPRAYDLGKQGRSAFNRKLGLRIDSRQLTLTAQDLLYATDYLIKVEKGLKDLDDIDHLKNRRVRTSGELIQIQIGVALVRLEKAIRDKINKTTIQFYVLAHNHTVDSEPPLFPSLLLDVPCVCGSHVATAHADPKGPPSGGNKKMGIGICPSFCPCAFSPTVKGSKTNEVGKKEHQTKYQQDQPFSTMYKIPARSCGARTSFFPCSMAATGPGESPSGPFFPPEGGPFGSACAVQKIGHIPMPNFLHATWLPHTQGTKERHIPMSRFLTAPESYRRTTMGAGLPRPALSKKERRACISSPVDFYTTPYLFQNNSGARPGVAQQKPASLLPGRPASGEGPIESVGFGFKTISLLPWSVLGLAEQNRSEWKQASSEAGKRDSPPPAFFFSRKYVADAPYFVNTAVPLLILYFSFATLAKKNKTQSGELRLSSGAQKFRHIPMPKFLPVAKLLANVPTFLDFFACGKKRKELQKERNFKNLSFVARKNISQFPPEGETLKHKTLTGQEKSVSISHIGRTTSSKKARKGQILRSSERQRLTLSNLINNKAFNSALREFFGTSPLSQFMDQINPLAEITHKRRLSSMGPGGVTRDTATLAIRGIHPTHYGRICPVETPEGKNTGLVNSMTAYARVNPLGMLESPFYKVYKGIVLKNYGMFFLSAEQEEKTKLAASDLFVTPIGFLPNTNIPVRISENFTKIHRNNVEYIGVSPIQMISIATSLIPFLEHDDANRALMGSNMQRQAVPLIRPERPIVGTGLEPRAVSDSGYVIQSKYSGVVTYVSAVKIVVTTL